MDLGKILTTYISKQWLLYKIYNEYLESIIKNKIINILQIDSQKGHYTKEDKEWSLRKLKCCNIINHDKMQLQWDINRMLK